MNDKAQCASATVSLGNYKGKLVPGPEHETGSLASLPKSLPRLVLMAFLSGIDVSDLRREEEADAARHIRERIWQHAIDDREAYARQAVAP